MTSQKRTVMSFIDIFWSYVLLKLVAVSLTSSYVLFSYPK